MLTQKLTLLTEDCDAKRELRLSRLFQLLQEISIADTEALGYPREKTLDKGLLWVLGKQRVEISRLPVYGEKVVLTSSPGKRIPFLFPRHCVMETEGGELLLKASSVWALIDQKTRVMVNPEEHGVVIEGKEEGGEIPFQFPMKSFPLMGRVCFQAEWRDCDLNGHLNNTAYLDKAENLIPIPFLLSFSPKEIEIAYRKEIPLGEKTEVSYGEENGTYVFSCPEFFLRLLFQR